jgi:hypothetical protein
MGITAFRNPSGWFGNMITVDDQLYITLDYTGIILALRGDSLVKFFESKEFSSVAFGASAPYSDHKKIVGSWGGGIFIFSPANVSKPGKKVWSSCHPGAAGNKNLSKAVKVYPVGSGIFAARTDKPELLF